VAAADQPLNHLISADAVVSAESDACAVDHEARSRQRLEGRGNQPVRVEVICPGDTAAERQVAVLQREGLVAGEAKFGARVGDTLCAIGQGES
jgi:hypothetical protein